jgi:hypothetical protein
LDAPPPPGDLCVVDIVSGRDGVIQLSSAGIEISMSGLYDGIVLEEDIES